MRCRRKLEKKRPIFGTTKLRLARTGTGFSARGLLGRVNEAEMDQDLAVVQAKEGLREENNS